MKLGYYYIAIIGPVALYAYLSKIIVLLPHSLLFFLLFYLFIYRPIVDRLRLIYLNIIAKDDSFCEVYNKIPYLNIKYFREIYFNCQINT